MMVCTEVDGVMETNEESVFFQLAMSLQRIDYFLRFQYCIVCSHSTRGFLHSMPFVNEIEKNKKTKKKTLLTFWTDVKGLGRFERGKKLDIATKKLEMRRKLEKSQIRI